MPTQKDDSGKSPQVPGEISWEANIPLLTDQFVMYDTLKVWGISSLILIVIMTAIFIYEQNWRNLFKIMPLVGLVSLGILMLFILVMLIFFGNRFPMGFAINSKGVMMVTLSQRGRWGNRLAVILGALSASPGLAGAGLLAMARESVGMSWHEVRRIKVHPQARVISLMDSWHVVVRLYCTPKNYDVVLESVEKWAAKGLRQAAQAKPVRGLSPGLRLLIKSLITAGAAFLITAFPLDVPGVLIWALLVAGLGALWLLVFQRFFGIVSLVLAGLILVGFLSQGLEVRQLTSPEEFRKFAASRGLKIDTVPDWIIGKYRRYEHFDAQDWTRTGIGVLGLAFFVWTGVSALQSPRKESPSDGVPSA